MTTEGRKLEKLALSYEARAQRAGERFQISGEQRQIRERERYEDLADALRIAANSEEEHTELVQMRATLYRMLSRYDSGQSAERVMDDLMAWGEARGLISRRKTVEGISDEQVH